MSGPWNTGGVKPMPIEGRMKNERERLRGMTDTERAWRKQYLKDQVLAENEPRYVPELYRELYNPIRRLYKVPLDVVCTKLIPVIDWTRRYGWTYMTTRPRSLPGDADFPRGNERVNPNDYADNGFKDRRVFLE